MASMLIICFLQFLNLCLLGTKSDKILGRKLEITLIDSKCSRGKVETVIRIILRLIVNELALTVLLNPGRKAEFEYY